MSGKSATKWMGIASVERDTVDADISPGPKSVEDLLSLARYLQTREGFPERPDVDLIFLKGFVKRLWESMRRLSNGANLPEDPTDKIDTLGDARRAIDTVVSWCYGKLEEDGGSASSDAGNGIVWHKENESPPPEYPHGPLEGNKEQLAKWILKNADHRSLHKPLKNGIYWGRQNQRTHCSIWFTTQKRYAEANGEKLSEKR